MRKYIVSSRFRCFLACLLVLTIISGTWLMTRLSATPVYADETTPQDDSNSIVLHKSASKLNSDGETTITLEAYATGEKVITQQITVIPTDIVMVLDVSSSMTSHIGYKYSKQSLMNTTLDEKDNQYYIKDDNNYYLITSITRSTTIEGDSTVYTYKYTDSNGQLKTKTSKGYHSKPDFVYQLSEDTSSPTRLVALKEAAGDFVDLVIAKSKNTNNRVAVVTFGSNAAYKTGVDGASDALKNMNDKKEADEVKALFDISKNNLPISGATKPAEGLTYAKNIFDKYPLNGQTRNRVVVFFTDGTPGQTDGKWDSTSTDRANAAVNMSKTLKSSCGATLYAVGIFPCADGKSKGREYTTNTSTDKLALVAQYGNYFMQNVSANGTLPPDGISGYYFSANDSDSLSNIFTEIAQQVELGGSGTILDESTEIRDTISPYFIVPESTSKITFQKAAYNGEGADPWEASEAVTGVMAEINGSTLTVKGFDFSDNWVGKIKIANGDSSTPHGYKLIISFKVKVKPDYLGGSQTPTNGDDSGIYVGGNPVDIFDVPTVDVPLKTVHPIIGNSDGEWNIYLTTEKEIAENFNKSEFTVENQNMDFDKIFNGINNAGVNVFFVLKKGNEEINTFTVYKGETVGSWEKDMPALSDGSYTVECIVEDAGAAADKTPQESAKAEANVIINVFRPLPIFEDKYVYYGEKFDLSEIVPADVEWKCGEKSDEDVTMNTIKPIIEVINVTAADTDKINDAGYVSVTENFSADAELRVGDRALNISNAFTIYVRTKSLSIKKLVEGSLADKTKKFSFEVTITHDELENYNKEETFSLADNETKLLDKLPKNAKFTITEKDIPKGYIVTAEIDGNSITGVQTEDEQKFDYWIEGMLSDDETDVVVTNTLETVPPTGIDDGNLMSEYVIILFSVSGLITLHIIAIRKKSKYFGRHFV